MSEQHAPPPLKRGKDARPELRDALRALGKQDESSARLARVGDKLAPLFEGGAAPAVGSALLRQAQRKLLWGRLAVAALAIGATAVWLHSAAPTPPVAPPTAHAPSVQARSAAPVAQGPSAAAPAVEGASVERAVAAPLPSELRAVAARPEHHRSLTRAARAVRARRAQGVTRHDALSTAPAASTANDAAARPAEALARAQPAAAEPAAAEPPPPDAPALSEVDLLFAARQRMRSDPQGALTLLDEHKARFGEGQLAPEREVLAIEALRRLGQSHAASARLADFRARYPSSLHLRRLEQP
jgi:hypothetical protein